MGTLQPGCTLTDEVGYEEEHILGVGLSRRKI